MLPAPFIMEGSSNHNNSDLCLPFNDSVILNSVRNRKKNSELPNCPVCSCTIRQGELDGHLTYEFERLYKLSYCAANKRKASTSTSASVSASNSAMLEPSTDEPEEPQFDATGGTGSDVYQRVHHNRLRRLRSRARRASPLPESGECPICNEVLPMSRLHRHAVRCLKRTGANVDDNVPDTSSEEGTIDVENDEPQGGGSFGAEYQWCGEWRVRATALQEVDAIPATHVRRVSNDTALVVDGDEDTELYGQPQYSPSRIAPDADISVDCQTEEADSSPNNMNIEEQIQHEPVVVENGKRGNGLVEASVETRIQALKARIKELEARQKCGSKAKCLICLEPYTSPAVSIQCWHVYCEICWLESLRSKKICPQCNAITTTHHLRRIYM